MENEESESKYPIPDIIYHSLRQAILAEAKRLVKDIAKTLGKPEAPLWKEVSKETANFFLIEQPDPTNDTYECRAYEIQEGLYKVCRRPVIYGTCLCPTHAPEVIKKPPANLPILQKVYSDGTLKAYINPATNEVHDPQTLEKIEGQWNPSEKRLILFLKS